MRLLATITLIAIASSSAIHRPTWVAKCARIRIVFGTIFAVGKRCTVGGECRIIRHECAVGGWAMWVRAAWALTFPRFTISTVTAVTSATTTAIATRASGAILLLAVRAYRIRIYRGRAICARRCICITRSSAVGIQPIGDLRRWLAGCVLGTRLARWACSAWITRCTWKARRASRSGRLCINVWRAAVLLIRHGRYTGLARKHLLILDHARLPGWSRWACLIRVTRWSRLSRLALTSGPRLSTLTRCPLLALRFSKCGIHVAVDVPRFVIIVTAIAVASVAIVHVIHLSEP